MKVLKSFVLDYDVAKSLPELAGGKSMSAYITNLLRAEMRKTGIINTGDRMTSGG